MESASQRLPSLHYCNILRMYEFLQRQNEVRVLKIELAQLQWKVDVTQRVLPEIPLLEADIAQMKK